MSREDLVRTAFANQSDWCAQLGSPFTARLTAVLGRHLDRTTRAGRTVLDWTGPPDALGDAVPLRLAGALHALVRRGRLPDLARLYPPHPLPGEADLAAGALAALREADAEICEWLDYAPQTNEVARSAVLYPGLMTVAAMTGLPLALFEVGASAGLNLIPERYAYRLGDRSQGRPGSPVVLSPKWTGARPPETEPLIQSRRGCDRSPLDLTKAAHRERLIAYVWPDQEERLARVQSAIALAAEDPPGIDAADAADWVDDMIGSPPERGVARVIYHSIAYQYFPEETKRRIAARVRTTGEQSSRETPLAWLDFELAQDQSPVLTLRLWPGGTETVLARGDSHGREIHWLGDPA